MRYLKVFPFIILFASFAFSATSTYIANISIGYGLGMPESGLWPQNYRTLPSIVESGDQDIILVTDIQHFGSRTYRNLSVEAKFQDPFEPVKDTYFVEKINPKDIYTISFRFNVKETDPGVFALPIEIIYYDTTTKGYYKAIRKIYLQVSAVPRLEIVRIETTPAAKAGEEFNLNFYVQNNGDLPSSEVIAKISSNVSAFITWIPDEQLVRNILPDTEEIISFKGVVSSKTESNAYAGTLILNFSSNQTLSNVFVVDIGGTPKLRLAGVTTDLDTVHSGEKFSLSIQLENTGYGDARSVKIYTEDSSVKGLRESFIGTVEVDDTGTGILDISIDKTGEYQIPMIVEFEDSTGAASSMTAMATVYIYPASIDFSGVVVVLILVFVFVFYYLRKKKKFKLLEKIR